MTNTNLKSGHTVNFHPSLLTGDGPGVLKTLLWVLLTLKHVFYHQSIHVTLIDSLVCNSPVTILILGENKGYTVVMRACF